MPTIAFVSPKGGSGKTTSFFLLSMALAKLYDVTVIDADPNHPIQTWANGGKRLPARFYRSDAGREPVREWLKGLDLADRKVIGEDMKDVEFSWPIGSRWSARWGTNCGKFEAVFRVAGLRG